MKSFRYISTLVLILLLSACGNTPIRDDINWTHTEHDQINFYLDDEACLKQVNSTLFESAGTTDTIFTRISKRLDRISNQDTSNKVCKSNNDRNILHYNCMIKKGWSAE